MEQASNGARLASSGIWVFRNGGYYGFGETPHEALMDSKHRYVALPREHDALVEFIKAGHSDGGGA